ncbi:enoyl-CoA hydratase/isomerase [Calothrix sp. NIES-4071]|nr:enoyl-CoA hydratase/isomerase [Calothrix sp. NIES-4071]BAZ57728.1 enoyl-CoA hydratase/isomerase [Calothrix sp. NIES-4105]
MKAITLDDYVNKYESIRMQRHNGILEVTLHTNGDSLVFNKTIHDELGFAFADIGADRENKVVILTGAGENFCADFDPESFKSFGGLGKDITATGWDQTYWRGRHNVITQLDIPVPMIGVVNGPAIAHSELALLCDIVLASETAVFQDFPHFGNGVAPGDGIQVMWMLLLGVNRGRYFLLTQQKLSAQEAFDFGAVNEVLPPDKLLPRACELAAQMAQKPPLALRYARLLLTQQLKRLMEDGVSIGLALEGLSAIDVERQQG